MSADLERLEDPDPIGIGVALFAAVVAGGAWLEARRQRLDEAEAEDRRFRSAWATAARAVARLDHAVTDFEIAINEFNFGTAPARPGGVRLEVKPSERRYLRNLSQEMRDTAEDMEKAFDDLSAQLPLDYEDSVYRVQQTIHHSMTILEDDYVNMVIVARDMTSSYDDLIREIGDREGFNSADPRYR